jgi:hypothetical protein
VLWAQHGSVNGLGEDHDAQTYEWLRMIEDMLSFEKAESEAGASVQLAVASISCKQRRCVKIANSRRF